MPVDVELRPERTLGGGNAAARADVASDASTPVMRRPADRSHALTDATAAAVGSNRARYCAGVRKWRYDALPGVDTAETAARSAAMPPRGAR